jgi:hypothetical protein
MRLWESAHSIMLGSITFTMIGYGVVPLFPAAARGYLLAHAHAELVQIRDRHRRDQQW